MKSLLQGLYAGEISPDELIVPKSREYRSMNRKIGEEKEYLKSRLSVEDCKRFEELDYLLMQTGSMNSEASFSYGFRLGVMLMIEVFTGKDELIRSSD